MTQIKITHFSDTHGNHKDLFFPGGDILVCTGDFEKTHSISYVQRFLDWFDSQDYTHKILVAGNHDIQLYKLLRKEQKVLDFKSIIYLVDSEVTIEGIKFYGTPWQPEFLDWAFNLPRNGSQLKSVWSRIPIDTDVLLTHTPPFGIMDKNKANISVGCEMLLDRVQELNLKAHMFGHIHESFGLTQDYGTDLITSNASYPKYKNFNEFYLEGN